MIKKYYAGIGSRQSPPDILQIITDLAKHMASEGYILRSGGAGGADAAFEAGAGDLKEIFRPDDATEKAIRLAGTLHPAWYCCNLYVRKLHGRNAQIILGRNLDEPALITYCWTPGGKNIGGAGMGIKISAYNSIEVKNLAKPKVLAEVIEMLKTEEK